MAAGDIGMITCDHMLSTQGHPLRNRHSLQEVGVATGKQDKQGEAQETAF